MTSSFRPRQTRPVGVRAVGGERIKWYEISADGSAVDGAILDAAHAVADRHLPSDNGRVGFAIVHTGLDAVWLLIDRWDGDILCQRTFRSELHHPTEFAEVAPGGPTACVWELTVHSHERDAYVRHVLSPSDGPDLDGYLADTVCVDERRSRTARDVIAGFEHAWATADVDALMALMTDDPVYRASTGDGPGTEYRGTESVRAGFAAVLAAEAGLAPHAGLASSCTDVVSTLPQREPIIDGDRAVSFWSYPAAMPDGRATIIEGVDVWTLSGGRLAAKDAYRKALPKS